MKNTILYNSDKISHIEVWERYDEKNNEWKHNHISFGWTARRKPKPISDEQERSWKDAKWIKTFARLVNNKVEIHCGKKPVMIIADDPYEDMPDGKREKLSNWINDEFTKRLNDSEDAVCYNCGEDLNNCNCRHKI